MKSAAEQIAEEAGELESVQVGRLSFLFRREHPCLTILMWRTLDFLDETPRSIERRWRRRQNFQRV